MNSQEEPTRAASKFLSQLRQWSRLSRREALRGGGLMVAGTLAGPLMPRRAKSFSAAAKGVLPAAADTVYTRIGVRPFINLTAAYTIHSGLQTLPSVKRAMEEASYHSVNMDELMEKVGA